MQPAICTRYHKMRYHTLHLCSRCERSTYDRQSSVHHLTARLPSHLPCIRSYVMNPRGDINAKTIFA